MPCLGLVRAPPNKDCVVGKPSRCGKRNETLHNSEKGEKEKFVHDGNVSRTQYHQFEYDQSV
jgi:hypothetical protein